MQKISIKREQSQAGLSFAKREKFRPQVKNKLLLLLVLLMTAATGAWADETPLVTIESTDNMSFKSGSKTFDNKVTVTFSNEVKNEGDNYGWFVTAPASLLTVAGTNGYTITSCKFYTSGGTAANGYTVEGESPSVYLYNGRVYNDANQSVTLGFPGVTKIEVYGTAPAPRHLITATYFEQTRSLEQPLPYATTIGELYEAVTGHSFSDLISTMSAVEMTLTGITSNNTSVVIGEFNGASTPVTVKADGKATIGLKFGNYVQAIFFNVVSPLYVTMADGTSDDYKWTASTDGTNFGALPIGGLKGDGSETVTLKYNGRLKVKSVTATSDAAPAVKPAATVTTAPKGAAIVGVGKSTELVSGGVADGGTLMYAVTTTNTKPTSTAGFSADVPTAQTITASGKVYVWYYVKGDDTHSDSEIAATAIEVPVADIVWDVTNVKDLDFYGTDSYQKEGVTLSGNAENMYAVWADFNDPTRDGIAFQMYESGGFTFTAPTGKKFTKIEMKANGSDGWNEANLGTGWAFNNPTATWTGSAASTVKLLTGTDEFLGPTVKYIAFYLSE